MTLPHHTLRVVAAALLVAAGVLAGADAGPKLSTASDVARVDAGNAVDPGPAPVGASPSRLLADGSSPTPLTTVAVLRDDDAVVAIAPHGVTVHRSPSGRVLQRLSARTSLDSVRTLLVVDQRRDGWLQVLLPVRPNGTLGWVSPGSVALTDNPMRIVVNRSHRVLVLLRAGKPVARYKVAVGTAETPTPAGLFYVTDRLPTGDPGGPFGPFAFGLSGHSDVLTSFDGGDGIIGIHGTNADWSVGLAASHGCIRLHDRDISRLYRQVPLGTPVIVR